MKNEKIKNKKRKSINVYAIIMFVLLSVYTAVLLIHLAWATMKSFHDFDDYLLSGALAYSWPGEFTFKNYVLAFDKIQCTLGRQYGGYTVYFGEMIWNSVLYAIGGGIVATVTPLVMAYVTAKHDFILNKFITGAFFFKMLVPILGTTSASLKLTMDLGLYNTWLGAFIMKLNYVDGVAFLLFQAAFKSLDDGYKEAAVIDGASHFRIMVTICFPLVKTTIMTIFLTKFIGFWNDYQTPMLYLPGKPTAAYGLYIFNGTQTSGSSMSYLVYKVAGFMILLLPVMILFILLKDKLLGSTVEGGLKG